MLLRRSAVAVMLLCSGVLALTIHSRAAHHRSRSLPITCSSPAARQSFHQAMADFENLRTEQALAEWRKAAEDRKSVV